MPTHRLTTSSVRKLAPGWWWDTDITGFGIALRERGRGSFMVQKVVAGRSLRRKVGDYPTWTVDQARARAQEMLVQMAQGRDPLAEQRAARARGTTLAEAVRAHVAAMRARGCSARSVEDVEEETKRHLGDWLARPLSAIRKADCVARHRRITDKSGAYAANHAMRALRAAWNTAARQSDDDGFPTCPVRAVTFNRERRRREPVADFPAWRAAVDALVNPVRRDLQLFLVFTGLRSTDAKTVRWEHVDLEDGTMFRPKPKGGADRAFTVPLAKAVVDLLRARRDQNEILFPDGDGGWVFPTADRDGKVTHVQEIKEQRLVDGKKTAALPSPHRLRDTFASAAHAAGVDLTTLACLMNHRLPRGSVTAGYINPTVGNTLRDAVGRIAAWLDAAMAAQAAAS